MKQLHRHSNSSIFVHYWRANFKTVSKCCAVLKWKCLPMFLKQWFLGNFLHENYSFLVCDITYSGITYFLNLMDIAYIKKSWYETARCHIPKDNSFHSYYCKNLKSQIFFVFMYITHSGKWHNILYDSKINIQREPTSAHVSVVNFWTAFY